MEIFLLSSNYADYKMLTFASEEWSGLERAFKGESLKATWKARHVRYRHQQLGSEYGDSPYLFPSVQILTEEARAVLENNWHKYGEFLQLNCDENSPLYLYNVTKINPAALDTHKSIISPRTGVVKSYAFKPSEISRNEIFKIPQDNKTSIFVEGSVRNTIEKNKLRGFSFQKV